MAMHVIKPVSEIKADFRAAYSGAMEDKSTEKMMEAIEAYAGDISCAMLEEYRQMSEAQRTDAAVLAARGVRQLSAAENKYYSALIKAMGSSTGTVKSALENLEVVMPETIVDGVMEDIRTAFPLLDKIDFVNSSYMTTYLYNKQDAQLATWGPLCSAIVTELNGAFGALSMTQCKLSAYMAICKDYLALGPAWMDRYVRAVLSEAVGLALEAAIVDGDGSEPCPIGMTRNLDAGTTTNDVTTYARKTAVKVTQLSPAVYGSLLDSLSQTPTGRRRQVGRVMLVCNPSDYFTKIMPATTYMTPQGGYVKDILPYDTDIVQATGCPANYAVLGIPKRYLAGIGFGGKTGAITYDDSYQFLEDKRVYMAKLLGNGRPKDNLSFVLLDISGLEPLAWSAGSSDTPSST